VSIVTDAAAQRAGFRGGQFQFVQGDSPSNSELQALIRSNPDTVAYELTSQKGAGIFFVAFRADQPPFSDVNVRRAISMAIDREAIIKGIYEGRASVMHPIQYALIRDTQPSLADLGPNYQYNPTQARQLLKNAGVAEGVEWDFLYVPFGPDIDSVAQLVQQQLKQVGVNLKLNKVDIGTYTAQYYTGQFPHLAYGAVRTFPVDPALSMYAHLHTGQVQNTCKFSDPKLDKLLDDLIA